MKWLIDILVFHMNLNRKFKERKMDKEKSFGEYEVEVKE
jgi:hypothetical protein